MIEEGVAWLAEGVVGTRAVIAAPAADCAISVVTDGNAAERVR